MAMSGFINPQRIKIKFQAIAIKVNKYKFLHENKICSKEYRLNKKAANMFCKIYPFYSDRIQKMKS